MVNKLKAGQRSLIKAMRLLQVVVLNIIQTYRYSAALNTTLQFYLQMYAFSTFQCR